MDRTGVELSESPAAPANDTNTLSMAVGSWATGVSLFRINVRLSGRQKCHSVMLPWYQMMTS